MSKDAKLEMFETAVELVFTYPDWNAEHVHEYYICAYTKPKYSEDDFYVACQVAEVIKRGMDNPTYDAVLAEVKHDISLL
jgi:hypothetical protein